MRRAAALVALAAALTFAACSTASNDSGTTGPPPDSSEPIPTIGAAPVTDAFGDEFDDVSALQRELMTPAPGRQAVTFRHDAPDADVVLLEFTGNYWNRNPADTVELMRVDDGESSHAVTLHLGPDQWLYRYRVDGRWETDADAPQVGAENAMSNSVLRLGDPVADSTPVDEEAGSVETIELDSDVLGRTVPYVLYTPSPTVAVADGRPLDVLVLLHGYGQPATDWAEAVGIGHFMDNLITDGRIEPFAIVMPSGENSSYAGNRGLHVVDEVIPDAQRRLGVRPDSAHMAVGGFSQGGNGALRLAALRPDEFGLVMPIAMAGPCGGRCDESLYNQIYPDGFDATFALWVGVHDELGLDLEHDRFTAFASDRGIEFEDVRTESDGHRWDGHSIRYVRTIASDILIRADRFFQTST